MLAISLFYRPPDDYSGDAPSVEFVTVARLADQAGLYSIHCGEHLLVGERTDRYPFGPWPHRPTTSWPDPLMCLAAAASVTRRIKLATGVLLAPLRSGPMLAKQLATLDVLSGGRIMPGLGVGWQPEEYAASGLAYGRRYAMFDETLRACRELWGAQPVDLAAPDGSTERVVARPTPTQERIPILLGLAATPRNIRRIVEFGDGWCPVRLPPDELAAGVRLIRAAFEDAGRDPNRLIVRTQAPLRFNAAGRVDVRRTLSISAAFEEAGATILAVSLPPGPQSAADVAAFVADLAAESR